MRKARFTEHQNIAVIKLVETGRTVKDICPEDGISEATYYTCCKKYGGMAVPEVKRLKSFEEESARLKKLLSEAILDKGALQVALGQKCWRQTRSGKLWY